MSTTDEPLGFGVLFSGEVAPVEIVDVPTEPLLLGVSMIPLGFEDGSSKPDVVGCDDVWTD